MGMRVTAIKAQVKREGRYSIFVDGKYSFSLSADALLDAHLINGQELNEADVQTYKKLSSDDKAYGLALEYVARRMRSEGDCVTIFGVKSTNQNLQTKSLQNLREVGT